MRPLVSRRAATAVVCAALVLGAAGPAVASPHAPPRKAGVDIPRAPLPDSPALRRQAEALQGVVTPVSNLIKDVLETGNGRLTTADAARHTVAIRDALETLKDVTPAPGSGTRTVAPADGSGRAAPADLTDDALAAVRKITDALIDAATAGDASAILPKVTTLVTALVNLVLATLLGSGLPPADLPALTTLPDLTTLPVTPEVAAAPQLPETFLAPVTPQLPTAASLPGLPT